MTQQKLREILTHIASYPRGDARDCKKGGIETVPYHPGSNGITVRTIGVLADYARPLRSPQITLG